jgi:cell wall-associated NlpC family hydrolase
MHGTPWIHQGRTPGVALDCVGFVEAVGRACGAVPMDLVIPADYGRTPKPGALEAFVSGFCTRTYEAVPGTLLLLRMPHSIRHVGLCTGETIIHCIQPYGVVEHGYRHPYTARTASIWRIPNVEYPDGW